MYCYIPNVPQGKEDFFKILFGYRKKRKT